MKISHVCTYVLMLCGGEGEVGEGGIEKGGGEEGEVGRKEVVVWNVPPYGTVEHLVLQWHIGQVR